MLDFAEAEARPAFGPRLRCLASEPSVHLVEEEAVERHDDRLKIVHIWEGVKITTPSFSSFAVAVAAVPGNFDLAQLVDVIPVVPRGMEYEKNDPRAEADLI